MADTLTDVEPYSTDWYNKMYALQKSQLEKENLAEYSKRGMYRSGMGIAGLDDALAKLQASLTSEMASNKQTSANLAAQIASNEKISSQETEARKQEAEASRDAATKSALVSGIAGVGGTLGGIGLYNHLQNKSADLAKTSPATATPATAGAAATAGDTASTFGSRFTGGLTSTGNMLSGLAGLGLGSLVGGNQNKAFGLGGLAGSGLGYGLGNALSAGLNLGGGYGAALSGLGALGGNILGRQL